MASKNIISRPRRATGNVEEAELEGHVAATGAVSVCGKYQAGRGRKFQAMHPSKKLRYCRPRGVMMSSPTELRPVSRFANFFNPCCRALADDWPRACAKREPEIQATWKD